MSDTKVVHLDIPETDPTNPMRSGGTIFSDIEGVIDLGVVEKVKETDPKTYGWHTTRAGISASGYVWFDEGWHEIVKHSGKILHHIFSETVEELWAEAVAIMEMYPYSYNSNSADTSGTTPASYQEIMGYHGATE